MLSARKLIISDARLSIHLHKRFVAIETQRLEVGAESTLGRRRVFKLKFTILA